MATLLAGVTRVIVQPENYLGGICVHAKNSLAGTRATAQIGTVRTLGRTLGQAAAARV